MKKLIEVNVSNFKDEFGYLNGKKNLNFSTLDLMRASITIGHSDWRRVFNGGRERILEIIHYTSGTILYARSHNGNFGLSEGFWNLDQSEKTLIIYRLGMVVTKLIAERLLEIYWLLHVDNLIKNGSAIITAGTHERGDLAGLDILKRWHVLESKGRSNKPEKEALKKGKNQAGRIQTISDQIPITKSVCLSHFQREQTIVYLNDPDNGGSLPTSWKIDINDYFLFYYQRILKQLNYENSYIENIGISQSEFEFRFFKIEGSSFEIGIFSPIVNNIKYDSIDFIEALKKFQILLKKNYPKDLEYSMSIGFDGIIGRNPIRILT